MKPADKTKPKTGGQQVRENAATAQKCALGANGNCAFCQRTGQPILPLRYAAVPTFLHQRPRHTLANAPTLGPAADPPFEINELAVRTLRAGYLHVYFGTPGFWQIYAVTADGLLRLLVDPDSPDEKKDRQMTVACVREGHNIPASFIHIPPRFQHREIYVAFAGEPWSRKTRAHYQKEPWKRMQSFDCEALASRDQDVIDAVKLAPDGSNLPGLVEEYVADAAGADARRRYPTKERIDEDRNKKLDERPGIWSSVHGFYPRTGQAAKVGDLVSQYAIDTDKLGKVRKVSAIVLKDDVGILQELNGVRLRCVQWLGEYACHPTIVRPLQVSKSILAFKQIIESQAAASLEAAEAKKGTPDIVSMTYPVDEFGNGVTVTTTRAERRAEAQKDAWARPASRYSEDDRKTFQDKYDKDVAEFQSLIARSDHDWALWGDESAWQEWLDDYDLGNRDSAANLVQLCAPCLAGGTASRHSVPLWERWLNGDPNQSPAYKGLFAGQKPLLDFLTPDGLNPNTDAVDKGDNSYDAVKNFVASKEFAKFDHDLLVDAAAKIQAAVTGAAMALGDTLSKRGEQILLRAQQAALKIYAHVEVTLLRLQLTVGEYHKFLSEQAFRRLESAIKDAVKAGSRSVRSIALTGILSIRDPKIRDTVVDITIWTLDNAERVRTALRNASAATGDALKAAQSQASAALRQVRVHAMTLGHESARVLRGLGNDISLGASQIARFARDVAGKTARAGGVVASGELMLAVGAVFFQGWSFKDGCKEMQSKFGKEKFESLLGVMADGIGVIAGAVEAAAVVIRNVGERLATSAATQLSRTATSLLAKAGWMAAVASLVEGVQAALASKRTFDAGDRDAGFAYALSAGLFVAGAGFSLAATVMGSSALLGPFGIAIGLLVLAVLALWWGITSEDTPREIWLDRCYFGYGERTEGKWTDAQYEDEITELNAVLLGLNAQLEWEDKLGMDKVNMRLTMPGFDDSRSAYEYTVSVRDRQGRWLAATGGRRNRPPPQLYFQAWDGVSKGMDLKDMFDFSDHGNSSFETDPYGGTALVVENSFRVSDDMFSATKVKFQYWADREDEDAISTIEHIVED